MADTPYAIGPRAERGREPGGRRRVLDPQHGGEALVDGGRILLCLDAALEDCDGALDLHHEGIGGHLLLPRASHQVVERLPRRERPPESPLDGRGLLDRKMREVVEEAAARFELDALGRPSDALNLERVPRIGEFRENDAHGFEIVAVSELGSGGGHAQLRVVSSVSANPAVASGAPSDRQTTPRAFVERVAPDEVLSQGLRGRPRS